MLEMNTMLEQVVTVTMRDLAFHAADVITARLIVQRMQLVTVLCIVSKHTPGKLHHTTSRVLCIVNTSSAKAVAMCCWCSLPVGGSSGRGTHSNKDTSMVTVIKQDAWSSHLRQ